MSFDSGYHAPRRRRDGAIGINWAQKQALVAWGASARGRAETEIGQGPKRALLVASVSNVTEEMSAPTRRSIDDTNAIATYKALTTRRFSLRPWVGPSAGTVRNVL